MKIRVIVKDVGDGDAIFFVLQRNRNVLISVIDGGRAQDSDKTIPHLDKILAEYGKSAPDLVVGTHYDNDHIAGLLPLLQHYKSPQTSLWMFDTSLILLRIKGILESSEVETGMFPTEDQSTIGSEYGVVGKQAGEFLLTSLRKEQEILDYARSIGMKIAEPVAGKCNYPGWPEIIVLGPTQVYYDNLFPERLAAKELVEDLIRSGELSEKIKVEDPCGRFTATKSPVSRINLLSAIIRVQVGDKLFLFTGDAGIDSFMAIPNYQEAIKGLYWLKMPHHGSANNMNSTLLDLMNPKQVHISGNKYVDNDLIQCMLTKGIEVHITGEKGDLIVEA